MPDAFRDDCRHWPRHVGGRERRAGWPRSHSRLTDPRAGHREPNAARVDRGLNALARFNADRRIRP